MAVHARRGAAAAVAADAPGLATSGPAAHDAAPDSTRRVRFDALDAVRGLAALAVVGFHAYKDIVKGAPGGSGAGTTIAYSLSWGVPVFFVLSGFLIYLPFAEALAGRRPMPDTARYLWRRAWRVLPGYWLVLVVFGTLAHPGTLWTPVGVVRYFLLLQLFDYQTIYHVLGTAWTLALEMSFYLALPVLAAAFAGFISAIERHTEEPRHGRRPGLSRPRAGSHLVAIAGFALGGIVLTRLLVQPLYAALGQDPRLGYFTLLDAAPMFAGGMALAAVRAHADELSPWLARLPRRLSAVAGRDTTWLVLAAAAYVAGLRFEGNAVTPWQPTYLALAAATLLLVPLVLRPEGRVALSLGRRRPLAWLGAVSYGLYLWHWPVQELLMAHGWAVPHTWAGYALALATVLSISLPLAWLTHRLVERPAIEWSRRHAPSDVLSAGRRPWASLQSHAVLRALIVARTTTPAGPGTRVHSSSPAAPSAGGSSSRGAAERSPRAAARAAKGGAACRTQPAVARRREADSPTTSSA